MSQRLGIRGHVWFWLDSGRRKSRKLRERGGYRWVRWFSPDLHVVYAATGFQINHRLARFQQHDLNEPTLSWRLIYLWLTTCTKSRPRKQQLMEDFQLYLAKHKLVADSPVKGSYLPGTECISKVGHLLKDRPWGKLEGEQCLPSKAVSP